MTKVIFVNGPPHSGKDTAARAIAEKFGAFSKKFAAPLERGVKGFFNLGFLEYERMREREKDLPQELLCGKSMRDVMISLSEDWAKRIFGKSVFGHIAAQSINLKEKLVVFSDCGFAEELRPVVSKVGVENCFILQLQREGCSYSNDSRSYVLVAEVQWERLNNVGDVSVFQKRVIHTLTDWVKK